MKKCTKCFTFHHVSKHKCCFQFHVCVIFVCVLCHSATSVGQKEFLKICTLGYLGLFSFNWFKLNSVCFVNLKHSSLMSVLLFSFVWSFFVPMANSRDREGSVLKPLADAPRASAYLVRWSIWDLWVENCLTGSVLHNLGFFWISCSKSYSLSFYWLIQVLRYSQSWPWAAESCVSSGKCSRWLLAPCGEAQSSQLWELCWVITFLSLHS